MSPVNPDYNPAKDAAGKLRFIADNPAYRIGVLREEDCRHAAALLLEQAAEIDRLNALLDRVPELCAQALKNVLSSTTGAREEQSNETSA